MNKSQWVKRDQATIDNMLKRLVDTYGDVMVQAIEKVSHELKKGRSHECPISSSQEDRVR